MKCLDGNVSCLCKNLGPQVSFTQSDVVLCRPGFSLSVATSHFRPLPARRVDAFTNQSARRHICRHGVFASACLAATGSLAFNTCAPVSPPSPSAASTRRHFVQQAENGVDSSWVPLREYTTRVCGSAFPHSTWIIAALCIEENVGVFFFLLPSLPPFLRLSLVTGSQETSAAARGRGHYSLK